MQVDTPNVIQLNQFRRIFGNEQRRSHAPALIYKAAHPNYRLRQEGIHMFIGLGVTLLVIWVLCFLVFHISAFAIHLLILFAVISFIFHFIRGRTA